MFPFFFLSVFGVVNKNKGPRVIPLAPEVTQAQQPQPVGLAPPSSSSSSFAQQQASSSPSSQQSQQSQQQQTAAPRVAQAPGAPSPASSSAPPAVDPSRVPCPADRWNSEKVVYSTFNKEVCPPPADSHFVAVDDGNAGPRFVRSTLYAAPANPDLWKKSTLPFSLVITPLASPQPGELEVPLVDVSAKGPLRCSRCGAYVCSAFSWQGRGFTCALCSHVNTTDEPQPDYTQGSVDLAVGPAFRLGTRKHPYPLAHVFVIDVSFTAQKSGVMQLALACLKSVVEHLSEEALHIAILTFSDVVHCYEMQTGDRPKVLVLHGDDSLEESFCASLNLVSTNRQLILKTLDLIPSLHTGSAMRQESDLPRALRAASAALEGRGGRVWALVGSNPMTLEDRLRAAAAKGNVLATDEERYLYSIDQKNTAWKDLTNSFSTRAVSLDFCVLCSTYVDIGTLSWVAGRTGGRVYYYPGGGPGDELKLQEEMRSRISRPQGYDAVLRVRTSKGLTATAYRGAFSNDRVSDELEVAAIDNTSTFCVDLVVDGDVGNIAVVQVALLYTTRQGQRVVRLHTISFPVATELPHLFRMADNDAVLYWTASMGAEWAMESGVKHARGEIARRVGEMLASYRQHCARNPAPGQLILPEALKLLPAYVLGLLKSQMMRPSTSIGPHLRCHYLRSMIPFSGGAAHLLTFCYPQAIPLHEIDETSTLHGFPDDFGGVHHPRPVRLLKSAIGTGVTLFDDGQSLRIFFSSDPAFIAQLLSEPWSPSEVDIRPCPWDAVAEARVSPWAQRVSNIVAARRLDSGVWKNVAVCKAGDADEALVVNALLVEDSVSSSMSLTGFLRHMHSKIQKDQ